MPQRVAKKNPVALKYQSGQESVLDTPITSIIRKILDLTGGNDPAGQVMGMIAPMMAFKPPVPSVYSPLKNTGNNIIRMLEDRAGNENALKRLSEQMKKIYGSSSPFEAEFGMPRKSK